MLPVIRFQLEKEYPVTDTFEVVTLIAKESNPQLRWFSQLVASLTSYGRYGVWVSQVEGVTSDIERFKMVNPANN